MAKFGVLLTSKEANEIFNGVTNEILSDTDNIQQVFNSGGNDHIYVVPNGSKYYDKALALLGIK